MPYPRERFLAPLLSLLTFCLLTFCLGEAVAEPLPDPLIVGTEGAYPPMNYYNEAGELAGFDVDMADAVCRRLQVRCEFRTAAFQELLPRLAAGEFHLVVASFGKTPLRAALVDYTDAYFRSSSYFIADPRRFKQAGAEHLAGKVIAAQRGTTQAGYLTRHYAQIAPVLLTETFPEAYQALADGKADLVLSPNLTAVPFLSSKIGEEFDFIGDPVGDPELFGPGYMQVQKGDDMLRQAVNQALKEVHALGEFNTISRRYFPFRMY